MFFTLFLGELNLVFSPSHGPRPCGWLSVLFPDRVPFQHTRYLHQLFMNLSVAILRVVPVLWPPAPGSDPKTLEQYATEADFIVHYLNFLLSINDENSACTPRVF